MITVEDAQLRIVRDKIPLPQELTDLRDALGRTLHHGLVSRLDLPPFDNASMDGYALRAEDTTTASPTHPASLSIDGLEAAGHPTSVPLRPKTARKIMTGAPIPPGANAVIPVEEVHTNGVILSIHHPVPLGLYVRQQAQDMRREEPLLSAGALLTPGLIGILASQGFVQVPVTRKPRVAILATGDELVNPGTDLLPGQIPNSNSYALAAAVVEAGGLAIDYSPVADDLDAVNQALHRAAADADIILSSGGVSVGDYDLVRTVLDREGTLDFWRVDMKPGKPVAFGTIDHTPFLGLPGNPVSSLVTFELFARPLIRTLLGDSCWQRLTIELPLATAFPEVSDRRHYVRVALRRDEEGTLKAWPTGRQDSHLQTSWLDARGLMVVPAHQGPLAQGSIWPIMMI
jgi:molybdopterin molybdotransferase